MDHPPGPVSREMLEKIVEVFKLTGIPAENQHVFLVRWFLGMTFSVVNLGYYFIGVVLIAFAGPGNPLHR